MIVRNQLRGFGDTTWDSWCDGSYPGDPTSLAKCKSTPLGPLSLAPWTDVGAIVRGITKPTAAAGAGTQAETGSVITSLLSVIGLAPAQEIAPGVPTQQASIGGIPKGMLYGGLALLGVGAVAAALSKPKSKRRR